MRADWFEVTNKGATPVNITGWQMDDDSNAFASAIALNGITEIAPGESVIFIETTRSRDDEGGVPDAPGSARTRPRACRSAATAAAASA